MTLVDLHSHNSLPGDYPELSLHSPSVALGIVYLSKREKERKKRTVTKTIK